MYKRVKEASYLTAEKAWSYRAILRYFYVQHERMRDFLFPEEIYEHLKKHPEFAEYSMEQLHQDLDALVKWGNLIARQEMGKSRTVEEFKKKRFRYQCTPYTVEFERMLAHLEDMGEQFGGSLERTQFERLYQCLLKIEKIILENTEVKNEECAQIWEDVLTYFQQIRQNTSDYIAYINSDDVESRMQTEAFLVYKDKFTTYLRDFIISLQSTALQIQELLEGTDREKLERFFARVLEHEQQVFRFDEDKEVRVEPIEEYLEKWASIKAWFLGNEHGESEYAMLQERTNEAIRRITRVAQRLGERHRQYRSRRKDYLHLARWFDSLDDIEEAHKFSSVVFGVFHTRHFHSDLSPTEDIYTDVWDEEPMEHVTKPMIRQYREKTRPGAAINHAKKKEAIRKQYLEQKRKEQQLLEKYISGNEIRIKDLPVVETYVRKLLLSWITKAMANGRRTIKTETGMKVDIELKDERVVLQAKDGMLEMPDVVFRFVDREAVDS